MRRKEITNYLTSLGDAAANSAPAGALTGGCAIDAQIARSGASSTPSQPTGTGAIAAGRRAYQALSSPPA